MSPVDQAYVIGIDPGMHTGFCVLQVFYEPTKGDFSSLPDVHTHPYIKLYGVRVVEIGTFEEHETPNELQALFDRTNRAAAGLVDVHVIVEHFVFTARSSGGGRYSVETTGFVKMVIHFFYDEFKLDTTQKSHTKGLVGNDKLTALKIKKRGDKQLDHAWDAARHAVQAVGRVRVHGWKTLRDEMSVYDNVKTD